MRAPSGACMAPPRSAPKRRASASGSKLAAGARMKRTAIVLAMLLGAACDEIEDGGAPPPAASEEANLLVTGPALGSIPHLVLLCQYAEETAPLPREWYVTHFGNSFGGMDHYIRQASYGLANLSGTQVYGWYRLPRSRAS